MALGDNLKAWREKKGWTTYELAEASGQNQSSISRYELNKVRPRPEALKKIADALGVQAVQLEHGMNNVEIIPIGTRKIPILDYVQAGRWTAVNDRPDEDQAADYVLTFADCSPGSFALIVRGDSMVPEFLEGDLVTVDPCVAPRPGDFVIAVESGGDAVFKRYKSLGLNEKGQEVFELRPLNEFYPSMRSDRLEIRIVGTVIEATRRYHTRWR